MVSSRRLRLALLALIVLCGLFVYNYTVRQLERSELQADIAAARANIDDAEAEHAVLEAELAIVESPDYLDRAARERFDLVMPGDTVMMPIQPTPDPAVQSSARAAQNTATQTAPTASELPIWRQWVVVFTTDEVQFP